MNTPRAAALLAGLIVVAGASGCSRTVTYQGYIADQTLTTGIAPGVDNRASVLATLGRPSFEGQFDDSDWYYVSRQSRSFAFALPRPSEQEVLHIRFDDTDNVALVERSGLEAISNISLYGRTTPTLGRDRGFFQDIFGNIGRVGAPMGPGGGAGSNTGSPGGM